MAPHTHTMTALSTYTRMHDAHTWRLHDTFTSRVHACST